MSIKTNFEIPRAKDENDIVRQGQRMSQDLSKNFKAIRKALGPAYNAVNPVSLDGVYVTQTFTGPSGTLFSDFTIPHGLGVTPSSFIISDFEINSGPTSAMQYTMVRLSWTASDITVRLNITTGTGTAFTGSFKLLILR